MNTNRIYSYDRESQRYVLKRSIQYRDEIGTITVPVGYISDGATFALDIESLSWWIHDYVSDMDDPCYDDGTPISTLEESLILGRVLHDEERFVRMVTWSISTFIYRTLKKVW